MSEKQLEETSITAMGDWLRLKAFCGKKGADSTAATETEERKKKIEKMKKLLEHQSLSKQSSGQAQTTQQKSKQIKTSLKFEFGWKHWSRSDKAFKQKKNQSGGGTRVWEVPKYACSDDCLRIAKNLFFLSSASSEGSLDEMVVMISNFNGDAINHLEEDGRSLPFTAERYKAVTGFTKPRLYLMSKTLGLSNSSDDEDLFVLALPPHDTDQQDNQPSQLIGTSEERKEYRNQLEREFETSLHQDRAKEDEKSRKEEAARSAINEEIARAESEAAELEKLRITQLGRVLAEPDEDESHVVVRVRHVSLRMVNRRFPEKSMMSNVYDWVASLSCNPKYFNLSVDPREPISPCESVQSALASILCMTEVDVPLPLIDGENDVSFFSGYDHTEFLDETVHDDHGYRHFGGSGDDSSTCNSRAENPYDVPVVTDQLPDVLMQDDGPTCPRTIQHLGNPKMQ